MTEATWTNGKKTVRGRWRYHYGPDRFSVELYQRDRTTGEKTKVFTVAGDSPEWGNWKLDRSALLQSEAGQGDGAGA